MTSVQYTLSQCMGISNLTDGALLRLMLAIVRNSNEINTCGNSRCEAKIWFGKLTLPLVPASV